MALTTIEAADMPYGPKSPMPHKRTGPGAGVSTTPCPVAPSRPMDPAKHRQPRKKK